MMMDGAKKHGLRVLVCGGRDFNQHVTIYRALDFLHEKRGITHIIAGGATGADRWAESWAWMNRAVVEYVCFRAAWKVYGRRAGPIRNARMIDDGKPDIVLAFPGGTGTADAVRQAKAVGLTVIEISHGN